MLAFSRLYRALDETTRTNRKVAAMVAYLHRAPPEDAIWAISFLIGRKPRQIVPTRKLRQWAAQAANIPDWLFDASYDVVGDLAETIALILPSSSTTSHLPLHHWVQQRLLPLRGMAEQEQQQAVLAAWRQLSTLQRFVWNKLITGGFRVGISQRLVTRALAALSGVDQAVIAHRLMGQWTPTVAVYRRLLARDTHDTDASRPYPFFLAYPLDTDVETLGSRNQWQAEWKWDGIRGQLIKRQDEVFVWSRGEELVTPRYPELARDGLMLPNGTVLDGEILPWDGQQPLPFGELQRRIGRKRIGPKLLAQVPVVLMSYDLLEHEGRDIRQEAYRVRRQWLQAVLTGLKAPCLLVSAPLPGSSWQDLAQAREQARGQGVEGIMLKRLTSPYRVGRRRGDWWKWKVDPYSVDAVLIYAQRGHGRRSGLFTDYTFAVWDQDRLVPFAKAYSGLTDAEIRRVDRFIQQNTLERFGPVRSVRPELVFEIAFENIRPSARHKSGLAVRFPRIARWRTDKKAAEADRLETIQALIQNAQRPPAQN